MAHFQIDLHTHTTASDGTYTATQLVQRATKRGIHILGIADHDTLDGLAEAYTAGQTLGVEIVPGIEFSTRHERDKNFLGIHLLGYFIDPAAPGLIQMVDKVKQGRIDQKITQIKKLQALGFKISVEAVFKRVGGVPGRPHIAAELIESNPDRFKSIGQVFDELLSPGRPAHVKRAFSLTVSQAIAVVKEAGGLPVFAHPGAYGNNIDAVCAVRNAKAEGVEGVEVYYPYEKGHRAKGNGSIWIGRIEQLALELELLQTGGTDFHGRPQDTIDLGDMGLTDKQFSVLKKGWRRLRKR